MSKKPKADAKDETGGVRRAGGCAKNCMFYLKEARGCHLKAGPIYLLDASTSNQACSDSELNI